VLPLLASLPFVLELEPGISGVGFAVDDHRRIIDELQGLGFAGVPERAVDKRRAEFLAGRLAAAHALKALGVSGRVARNPDGSPSWPEAVVGSITHGAGRALCAVARKTSLSSLGIDVELLMKEQASLELRRRICSASELAALARTLPAPEHHLVSLAFSAKESLYKCLYPQVGRFMEFAAAETVAARRVHSASGLMGELTLRLATDWSAQHRAGGELTSRFFIGSDHVETIVTLAA
jgi:enterobactin synthetase component D